MIKKITKLSLVATLAITSMSSLNAKDLSEAIKGVDISGTVVYRYNDYKAKDVNNASSKNSTENYYKIVTNIKVPVNENVAMNATLAVNNGFSGWNTSTAADTNVDLELTKVNFTYTGLSNTSITIGKQGIPTPFTNPSDSDAGESIGTGALAITSMGPVSLVAAYFNQTNIDNVKTLATDGTNIATIGVMGKVAGLGLDAWYAEQIDSLDAWTIGGKYDIKLDGAKISLEARHSELEVDGSTTDNELTILGLKVKAGIFDAKVRYGMGGNDGSQVAFTKYGKAAMVGWNTELGDSSRPDADYLQTSIGVKITDTIHISANYNEVDTNIINDREEETFAQLTWKPSKNFKTYIRMGEYEEDDNEKSNVGRLQVQYSF